MGTIAVDYSIVYLPPSGTGASTALTFAGFVQFQGGMSTRDFSVTLPDNAFLEIGGNFMATIDNATLVSGGIAIVFTYLPAYLHRFVLCSHLLDSSRVVSTSWVTLPGFDSGAHRGYQWFHQLRHTVIPGISITILGSPPPPYSNTRTHVHITGAGGGGGGG